MLKPFKPRTLPLLPEGNINITDPDSRLVQDKGLAKVQGYNAQAAVSTDGQIIVAAEISLRSPDFGHLRPVFDAALRELERVGIGERPATVLADTGCWHGEQTDQIVATGTQVLIPPNRALARHPGRAGARGAMRSCARCWPATPVDSSTANARSRSSRPSDRSNTTAAFDNSDDAAEPQCVRSGG
jgi:hypothetical protein